MRQQRNLIQTKEHDKTPEEEQSEVEIGDLPDKEFRVMIIKILKKLERRIDEHSEKFNKESEDIKKNQTDLKEQNCN